MNVLVSRPPQEIFQSHGKALLVGNQDGTGRRVDTFVVRGRLIQAQARAVRHLRTPNG